MMNSQRPADLGTSILAVLRRAEAAMTVSELCDELGSQLSPHERELGRTVDQCTVLRRLRQLATAGQVAGETTERRFQFIGPGGRAQSLTRGVLVFRALPERRIKGRKR